MQQQALAHDGDQSGRGQEQPLPGRRPNPRGHGQQTGNQGPEQVAEKQHNNGPVAQTIQPFYCRDFPAHANRSRHGDQGRHAEGAKIGACDNDHAGEAHRRRQPAKPVGFFAQQKYCEDHREDWRAKANGGGIGQGNNGNGKKHQGNPGHSGAGPKCISQRMPRARHHTGGIQRRQQK